MSTATRRVARPAPVRRRRRARRAAARSAAFLACCSVPASVPASAPASAVARFGFEGQFGGQPSAVPAGATPDAASVPDSADWAGSAAVNLSLSAGNSESATLGLDAEAGGGIGRFRLSLEGGAFRAGVSVGDRVAVGAPDDFMVRREPAPSPSANRAHFRVRLAGADGRRIGGFAAAGWERDLPAGVRGRYDLTAGVGRTLGGGSPGGLPAVDLSAGLSLVRQRDLVPDEDLAADTLAFRLDARSAGRLRALDLSLDTAAVWNLRERGDLRLDATGAAEVPITGRLALRTSLQTLFDARPALERIPLSPAAGAEPAGEVSARRARLDSIFLASLAVRW